MSAARHHAEWLSLVEVSGPFLSMEVLQRVFPDGLDLRADASSLRERLHVAYEEWRDADDLAIHRAWVRYVLREVLEYEPAQIVEAQALPPSCSIAVQEHGEVLAPTMALVDPPGRESAGRPRVLFSVVPRGQDLDAALRGARWKASPATRMMTLLHGAGVRLGVVTNGEQWMLVHAAPGETTTYVSFYANLWFDEPLTLRALASLLAARRLFGVADDATLEALFKLSAASQHEVTDQLGAQVRRAVEVVIQNIDRIDRGRGRALLVGIDEAKLYEAAVTVMMRLVFLFAAEERGLLLLGDAIFDQNYAVSTLREQLQAVADAHGGEVLQRRHDAWSRLLATFRAVHGGVEHEALRLPAYGGSLFDPDRFPFLEGRAPGTKYRETPAQPLPIDNLTVLDLLNSLQLLQVRGLGGGPAETRRLSFRALDVEQLGHVYEGLLDHTAKRARTAVVSLRGSKEPELEVEELKQRLARDGAEGFASYVAEASGMSVGAVQKALSYRLRADGERKLLQVCENRTDLYERVVPWMGLVREDVHGVPVVFPEGSVYVTEGTTRRSTGTHYTPRRLTEEVVKYALEPLVYTGPAEGLPREAWTLRAAKDLLALRVCDLAMGSGAFLVQVCRYLAERLVEAWEAAERAAGGGLVVTPEGELTASDPRERALPADVEERLALARRYVADRCLYGVDINPMAVEMAKLSLWLVTLQRDRPFTFVDHALRCGDSLLGATEPRHLEDFTLRPGENYGLLATADLRSLLRTAAAKRRELEALPSNHYDQIERKTRLHAEALAAVEAARAVGDLLVAMELRGLEGRAYETAQGAEGVVVKELLAGGWERDLAAAAAAARGARRPFHWVVEFPEVVERGGFDAVVGNPPFKFGTLATTELGAEYLQHLRRVMPSLHGKADLVVAFLRRATSLVASKSTVSIVATSSLIRGETLESGLRVLLRGGWHLFRAASPHPWPGVAGVEVVEISMGKSWRGGAILDGVGVAAISEDLCPADVDAPIDDTYELPETESLNAFMGLKVSPANVRVPAGEAIGLLNRFPGLTGVLVPAIGGDELYDLVDYRLASHSIDPEMGSLIGETWDPAHVGHLADVSFSKIAHVRPSAELKARLARSNLAFACGETSVHLAFSFVPRQGALLRHKLIVFPASSWAIFSIAQSSHHGAWAWVYGLRREARLVYSPKRCARTFPTPPVNESLNSIGERYHAHRAAIMASRHQGLTKTYNRFHAPDERGEDIATLRTLHVEMDRAVAAAYGWTDLALRHGFHETKQGLRYTISEAARRTVLDRLLALNHERYAEEVRKGLHDTGKAKARAAKPAVARMTEAAMPRPVQAGLFDAPIGRVVAVPKATGLDGPGAALLGALEAATGPLGKAALVAAAGLDEGAWTGAIDALKVQGLVEQRGEKRGAMYIRRRDR